MVLFLVCVVSWHPNIRAITMDTWAALNLPPLTFKT